MWMHEIATVVRTNIEEIDEAQEASSMQSPDSFRSHSNSHLTSSWVVAAAAAAMLKSWDRPQQSLSGASSCPAMLHRRRGGGRRSWES
mmetsp:Transcript_69539/g.157220  ORF Transcript_69539/g.157220 Transcript_69539/m.157220 type:complete len:88 (-) Transcript_69539:43-306(-)